MNASQQAKVHVYEGLGYRYLGVLGNHVAVVKAMSMGCHCVQLIDDSGKTIRTLIRRRT